MCYQRLFQDLFQNFIGNLITRNDKNGWKTEVHVFIFISKLQQNFIKYIKISTPHANWLSDNMYSDISSAKLVVNPVVDPKQSLLQRFYSNCLLHIENLKRRHLCINVYFSVFDLLIKSNYRYLLQMVNGKIL